MVLKYNKVAYRDLSKYVSGWKSISLFGFGEIGKFIFSILEHEGLSDKVTKIVDKCAILEDLEICNHLVTSPYSIEQSNDVLVIV